MVRFGAALFLGRMLPRWSRDRVFEAAYHELLADYLEPSDGARSLLRHLRRSVVCGDAPVSSCAPS